jgi:hypothetical protein
MTVAAPRRFAAIEAVVALGAPQDAGSWATAVAERPTSVGGRHAGVRAWPGSTMGLGRPRPLRLGA